MSEGIIKPRSNTSLVKERTLLKNRIKAIIAKDNISFTGTDLFGKAGRAWLDTQELPESATLMVHTYLSMIDSVNEHIKTIEKTIKEKSSNYPEVALLQTIPGFGPITAFLLVAEIGAISRFDNPKKFTSYFGLVPRISQSGNHAYYGRITKVGNPQVRWALVQAAHRIVRMDKEWQQFAHRIAYRSGKKKAIVAVARKLAVVVYAIMKRETGYKRESSIKKHKESMKA